MRQSESKPCRAEGANGLWKSRQDCEGVCRGLQLQEHGTLEFSAAYERYVNRENSGLRKAM